MEISSKSQEIELLERAKNGDKIAFNILLSNNYDMVKGYVIKITGNLPLAEDILQETMLAAVINIDKFIPKAKFSTWLITIATNKYRDWLRKNKNEAYGEDLFSLPISTENVEEEVMNRMDIEEIINLLKKLSYEKRASFILKHYYGYSYEEISVILHCPLGTVRSRIHYCAKKILTTMRGE